MNAVQERDEHIDSRSDLYRWFSSVFAREQDRDTWETQTSDAFLDLLDARAAEFGLEAEALALAEVLAGHRDDDIDELLLELAVDYAQLFIGPGPGQAPPFESVYTSKDGRLYGDAYAAVIDTLQREQIAVAKEFTAPADHAAVELAILAHLIERDGAAGADGAGPDAAEATFLKEHVLNWFPGWLSHIDEHARTDFYRAAARLLRRFLVGEGSRLDGTGSP